MKNESAAATTDRKPTMIKVLWVFTLLGSLLGGLFGVLGLLTAHGAPQEAAAAAIAVACAVIPYCFARAASELD